MARLGTSDRPLRVAIVGAGPAGLYAAQADRRMSIPGETCPTAWPRWPSSAGTTATPTTATWRSTWTASGWWWSATGNVAMDMTGMLVRSHDELARTGMADHALEALADSRIREVVMLGRRGAAQASFTTPELRGLGKLEGVDVVVDPANIELDPAARPGSRTTGRPGPTCATSRTTPPAPSGRRRAASPCASWPRRSSCWAPGVGSRRCGSSATSWSSTTTAASAPRAPANSR
jgi:hypothetical protein